MVLVCCWNPPPRRPLPTVHGTNPNQSKPIAHAPTTIKKHSTFETCSNICNLCSCRRSFSVSLKLRNAVATHQKITAFINEIGIWQRGSKQLSNDLPDNKHDYFFQYVDLAVTSMSASACKVNRWISSGCLRKIGTESGEPKVKHRISGA